MRIAAFLLALIVASPALADEPVVVLRGSSAPPPPAYVPPPQPTVVVQQVYVPVYYPVLAYGAFLPRHGPSYMGHGPTARRSR